MSLSSKCTYDWCVINGVCFSFNTPAGCSRPNCPDMHICKFHYFKQRVKLNHPSSGNCSVQTDEFRANRYTVQEDNYDEYNEEMYYEGNYGENHEEDENRQLRLKVAEFELRLKLAEEKLEVQQITHGVKLEQKEKEVELVKREKEVILAEKEGKIAELEVRLKLAEEKLEVQQTTHGAHMEQKQRELELLKKETEGKVAELEVRLKLAEEKLEVQQTTHGVYMEQKEKEVELLKRENEVIRAEKEGEKKKHEHQRNAMGIELQMKSVRLETEKQELLSSYRKQCKQLVIEKQGFIREIQSLRAQLGNVQARRQGPSLPHFK